MDLEAVVKKRIRPFHIERRRLTIAAALVAATVLGIQVVTTHNGGVGIASRNDPGPLAGAWRQAPTRGNTTAIEYRFEKGYETIAGDRHIASYRIEGESRVRVDHPGGQTSVYDLTEANVAYGKDIVLLRVVR